MSLRPVLQYITPHWRVLAGVVVLLLAAAATTLAQPWLAGKVTAALMADTPGPGGVRALLLLWAVLIIARAGLGFASQYTIGKTGETMTAALRSQLFHHLQALPVAFNGERRSGETLALLSNDVAQVSRFVTDTLVQLLPLAITFFGALLLMLQIHAGIAVAVALLLPLLVLGLKLASRRLRPLSRSWMEAYSDLVAFINENLGMRPAVKSFAREAHEQSGFDSRNAAVLALARQRLLLQSALGPAVGMLASLGVLLLLWLASAQLSAGTITAPELVSLLLYSMLLVQPLRGLANLYGSVQVTRGCAERIAKFLAEHPEPASGEGLPLQAAGRALSFEGVSFGYPGGEDVLRDVYLDIAPGEIIAITGANGAGKSTLAFLLQRLADPAAGCIRIGDSDIREVELGGLRRQVGVVAQHTLLMNGSIADNIAYGAPDTGREAIAAAARHAHADEFIEQLPKGYDTVIGDQGLRLSGGQRQRLALARTLLLDPPILVLDEATSMFDPAAEARFVEAFRHHNGERTVLLITHRPASLALADRVVVLEQGRIAPQANPRRGAAGR